MSKNYTVLIVDDDAAFRETLSDNIASWDYNVITAGGGQEALEKLKDNPVELMLLDIRMPGMDGIECLSQIKKFYPGVKVVMMTAFSEQTQEAIKLGALSILPKPLDIMALMGLLENLATSPWC